MIPDILLNQYNVKYNDLLHLCELNLETSRMSKKNHRLFKTPFAEDKMINLQPDKHNKKMAKPYQVRQVRKLFKRMEEAGYEIRC